MTSEQVTHPAGESNAQAKPPRKNPDHARWQCNSFLGELGAQIFFAHHAINNKVGINPHLRWTKCLREAVFLMKRVPERRDKKNQKLSAKPKIDTPQISYWRNANLLPTLDYGRTSGLDFRLLNLDVTGGKGDSAWRGNLIFGFEAKTDLFFHEFSTQTVHSKVGTDLILYVIGKVVEHVFKKLDSEANASEQSTVDAKALLTGPKRIIGPTLSETNEHLINEYEDVFRILKKRAAIDAPYLTKFLNSHRINVNYYGWEIPPTPISKVSGDLPVTKISSSIATAREFKNELARLNRKMKMCARDESFKNISTWINLSRQSTENNQTPVSKE